MYLTDREATQTLRRIGALSAPHSALFFDAISASYVRQRIAARSAWWFWEFAEYYISRTSVCVCVCNIRLALLGSLLGKDRR